MNKTFKTLLLGASVITAFAFASFADVAVTSFQLTNQLNTAVSLVSNPINAPGTNGIGTLTGKWVDTANFDKAGITVTATTTTTTTNAGNLVFTLTRANVSGSPVSADFETAPAYTITAPLVVGSAQSLVFTTNINDALWLNASTHVGVYSATNTGGAGASATNVVVKITRKKVAVSY